MKTLPVEYESYGACGPISTHPQAIRSGPGLKTIAPSQTNRRAEHSAKITSAGPAEGHAGRIRAGIRGAWSAGTPPQAELGANDEAYCRHPNRAPKPVRDQSPGRLATAPRRRPLRGRGKLEYFR
jgi:hypothetical protein